MELFTGHKREEREPAYRRVSSTALSEGSVGGSAERKERCPLPARSSASHVREKIALSKKTTTKNQPFGDEWRK